MTDEIEVLGYRSCRCGTLVIEYQFHCLGARCPACFENDFKLVRDVEIVNRGRRKPVQPGWRKDWNAKNPDRPRGKRWPDKKVDPDRRKRADDARLARVRAQRRLADLYPEMFEVLVAQERAVAGLPFKPSPLAMDGVMETYLRDHGYSAASTGGPVVDGNEPVQEDASAP